MLPINTELLSNELTKFEGTRLTVYDNTIIGVGHNLVHPVCINGITYDTSTTSITEEECGLLLEYDIDDTMTRLDRSIGWIDTKTELQRRGLVHMGFNLGVPGLLKFKNMLDAVKHDNVRAIIAEASDSKWYHQVSPHRSSYVILQLCNEVPVPDYTTQLTALWECAPLA